MFKCFNNELVEQVVYDAESFLEKNRDTFSQKSPRGDAKIHRMTSSKISSKLNLPKMVAFLGMLETVAPSSITS